MLPLTDAIAASTVAGHFTSVGELIFPRLLDEIF
jgi:hypothetical protein